MMANVGLMPAILVFCAACIGAATDIWKFRVYNALTFPLIISGLCYHTAQGGFNGFAASSAGMFFGFCVLFLPYLLGLMGAGDVKLLAGVGAWLGFTATCIVFVTSSLVAGLYAIVLIILRGKFKESWASVKLIAYRFAILGLQFGKDDMIEAYAAEPDSRLRLIPFGAMVPMIPNGTMAPFCGANTVCRTFGKCCTASRR